MLVQAIAPYKNRNPASIDEEEYLENLFNSLCACLMSAETRSRFHQAEGLYSPIYNQCFISSKSFGEPAAYWRGWNYRSFD